MGFQPNFVQVSQDAIWCRIQMLRQTLQGPGLRKETCDFHLTTTRRSGISTPETGGEAGEVPRCRWRGRGGELVRRSPLESESGAGGEAGGGSW